MFGNLLWLSFPYVLDNVINVRILFYPEVGLSVLHQSRISRAERLFNYDVIDSHAVGCNSNKQNDPIEDALRGRHALASLPAGI